MSLFARLKSGLTKSSSKIGGGITDIFTKKKLDDDTLEQLEELLIEADMGAGVAMELGAALRRQKFGKEVSDEEVKQALAQEVARILAPAQKPLVIDGTKKPHVIVVMGVNGNGKTTTIGKLAAQWKAEGKKVMLAAADTFRAAAVEQLQQWAERTGTPIVTGEANADPASVAYKALEQARTSGADVLVIDTAGRLHNQANLMEELKKITRVMQKLDSTAPHDVIQVLDATTGQNALAQVEQFLEGAGVTGLIVTKLDGTAKGGIIAALVKKFGLPVHYIGVGEGVDDLQVFDIESFSANLMGLQKIV